MGETAAVVALLRLALRTGSEYAEAVEREGSALTVLRGDLAADGSQMSLTPEDPAPLLRQAQADVDRWTAAGAQLLTVLDEDYPRNLRQVHDRPPLLFVAGRLRRDDDWSVAVIGSRRASAEGMAASKEMAVGLTHAGFVVVSGLAAGVDTAAHAAALAAGGRTVAVVGAGLDHVYPPENAALHKQIAERAAIVSQFWPDTPPSRQTFPMRNAVMSGLALGTVIVEASARSGARVQARRALGHGRPVFLLRRVLDQAWAAELADRPGVHVVDEPAQVIDIVERLNATDTLVE
ncbi:MAG TPA: DNA-processing protein DprA [Solirubrobacteraceae bacterium]|nr:DNA-processing protein DprA [Solirubrobacteraceae bacterium]